MKTGACQMLLLLLALIATPGSANEPAQAVHQPRAFGYFIGDVLTQKLELPADAADLSAIQLPPPQRLDSWFERLSSRMIEPAGGRAAIEIQTQIINSPTSPLKTELPGLTINIAGHDPLQLPALPITIAPLTGPLEPGSAGKPPLRPDTGALTLIDESSPRLFSRWLIALALVMLAWTGWLVWRNRSDRTRLPFERAWHKINKIKEPAHQIDAWQQLHQAFNQTAGRPVQLYEIETLFLKAPFLAEERHWIEQFFRQSNNNFFARDALDLSDQDFDLRTLAQRLRGLEKRSVR